MLRHTQGQLAIEIRRAQIVDKCWIFEIARVTTALAIDSASPDVAGRDGLDQ
jgi:hypothetical protein